MNEDSTLIIASNVKHNQPYHWDHFEEIIAKHDEYTPTKEKFLCVNGYAPEGILKRYKCFTQDLEEDIGWFNFLDIMSNALEAVKTENVLIVPYLTWITEKKLLTRFTVSGNVSEENLSLYNSSIIYGKLETVRKFFFNKRINHSLAYESNLFRFLENIVGINNIDSYVIPNNHLGISKRIIISREKWKDLNC
jgi:hypothetical protein